MRKIVYILYMRHQITRDLRIPVSKSTDLNILKQSNLDELLVVKLHTSVQLLADWLEAPNFFLKLTILNKHGKYILKNINVTYTL